MCPQRQTDLIPAGKPEAEIEISETLVRDLLAAQHPDLASLPITTLASGWDNVMYRLGDELTVRVPRRQMGAELIRSEQTWLPVLQPQLPLPIPTPVRLGTPTSFYPWPWSVLPWLPGDTADQHPLATNEAETWAEFLLALHTTAPEHAPVSEVRGIPIDRRIESTQTRIERLQKKDLYPKELDAIWQRGLAASPAVDKRWVHGDLHSQNVLVQQGRISAVIDWGDMNGGDEATDLASIWSLFDAPAARDLILERYSPDQALLERAQGWAVIFGVVLLDSGLINSPRHAVMGEAILTRLLQGQ
jgi:aminoglycoside phosphotransferase (APT) family kinase protein